MSEHAVWRGGRATRLLDRRAVAGGQRLQLAQQAIAADEAAKDGGAAGGGERVTARSRPKRERKLRVSTG